MVACKKHAVVTTGTSRTSGLPCAMALRLIRDLPRDRLSCPCRPRSSSAPHDLDASVGAPGPRDFVVRMTSFVRAHMHTATSPRPSHPAPNVRDDAYVPLVGQDEAEYARIPKNRNRNIFRRRAGQASPRAARRANQFAAAIANRASDEAERSRLMADAVVWQAS